MRTPGQNLPRRLIVSTNYQSRPYPQWRATVEGNPEVIGYGNTEAEAVADLYYIITDRESDEQDRWDGCGTGMLTDLDRQQNEGAPLRAWSPPKTVYAPDDGYNAAQGPHFNSNGWGKS